MDNIRIINHGQMRWTDLTAKREQLRRIIGHYVLKHRQE